MLRTNCVGDQTFQERSLGRMRAFAEAGKTVVLVSHDLGSVESLCDRVVVLEAGRIVFDGPAAQAMAEYQRRLATGHGTDLHIPELPEPTAHTTEDDDADEAQVDPLTHHVTIDAAELRLTDAEVDERAGAPRVDTGAPATVTVTLSPTAQLVGHGGLYVRLVVRRPDLAVPLYDSRTSYRVQYVAPPPPGEPLTCEVDLRLNVLSGTYLIDVEVGNAETDAVHAREDAAARVVVRGEPWDVGIVPLDAAFRIHNPRGVWPPESEPPPVEAGGPASHPDPLWPRGPMPRDADSSGKGPVRS